MRTALGTAGYHVLTPIQSAEIKPAMDARDFDVRSAHRSRDIELTRNEAWSSLICEYS
jgi:hypothetical protein